MRGITYVLLRKFRLFVQFVGNKSINIDRVDQIWALYNFGEEFQLYFINGVSMIRLPI